MLRDILIVIVNNQFKKNFMVKKKKFIVFVFCAFCRGIIRTRSSGIGAMPFHSVE